MAIQTSFYGLIFLFHLLIILHLVEGQGRHQSVCPKDFLCGSLGNMSFPFYNTTQFPSCGLCFLNCLDQNPQINLRPEEHLPPRLWPHIMNNTTNQIQIHVPKNCDVFENYFLPGNENVSFSMIPMLVPLLKCYHDIEISYDHKFSECEEVPHGFTIFYNYSNEGILAYNGDPPPHCSIIQLPLVNRNFKPDEEDFYHILADEISLNWSVIKTWPCIDCSHDQQCIVDLDNYSQDRYQCSNNSKGNVGRSWIWIAVVVPIVVILLVSTLLTYKIMRRRRLKAAEKKQREDFLHQFDTTDSFIDAQQNEYNRGENRHDVKMFGFGSIMAATNNLSSDNKLGEGGFGPVYKGKLLDGREIAVKRLSRTSGQGMIEFKNELILISKLQHTNLVRVLGCCIHQKEKMLVYEYMPNKSLDFFLFDPERKKGLHWPIRFNIIEGVAQGLLYLHKYSRMKVIHRDLKASNVLLDENMNPKIADFGMARIFKSNEAQANTNRVVGTYGYMSPEYAMEGTFSIKSDVFSFGVLILEIVSGRRNNNFYNPHIPLNLIGYAWELWKEGDALELKDKSPGEGFPSNQILRAIQVGLLCVQENAVDRPTMQQVISMFGSVSMALTSPKKPAYFIGRNDDDQQQSDKQKQDSVQDYSITSVEAR